MTGDPPVLDRPALWAALSNMQIDLPGCGRFATALAGRQGWTAAFAERVTQEYRRFLYLAATADSEVTPSKAVDEAWHLHLASPHYEEGLCRRLLGRRLEHRPGTGEPGEEERHRRQYEALRARYQTVFGELPPSDIWPGPPLREKEPATGWQRAADLASWTGTGAAIAAAGAYSLGYPVTTLILVSIALVLILPGLLVISLKARSGGGAGCGGGCAGGGHSNGNDCGSSCGGGGCGGGGCGGD